MTQRTLREPEAARYLSLSASFLRQSRSGLFAHRTPGPPFVKIGRAVRYLVEDLDAWLERHRQEASKGVSR
jgi:predicted DNA-binding transcriptional regulator AlpA